MDFYIERYKNRDELIFDCEVITPMFISGANPKQVELRAASIKGALRFWWRALYGNDNIEEMRKKEGDLFGNTEKKSKVRISIKNENPNTITGLSGGKTYNISKYNKPLNIFDYLAFGPYWKSKYIRPHIVPGSTFSLGIELSNCTQTEKSQIINALSCLHYYGSIGSRSRNGFGCISIKPQTEETKLEQFKNFDGELKKFTAFSKYSKIFEITYANTWEDALSDIGLAYREARLSIEQRHNFSLRPFIAKPLEVKNVHISDRHAKPYFLHVRKDIKNGKPIFIGTILFLPYLYNQNINKYKEACNKLNNFLSDKYINKGGH